MRSIVLGVALLCWFVTGSALAAVGFANSPMWFLTASEDEVVSELDSESTFALCNTWKKASDNKGLAGDKARFAIAAALERRGESPFLCQQMGFGN